MTDLDDPSIRILKELENGKKTAPELAKLTNLSRGQVHYRLKNKLADHVTQTGSEENPGSAASTTVWSLTDGGTSLLDDLDESPSTFSEIADIAEESRQDAESAKESVQQYRKKLNRLKDRQKAIKSALPADSWDTMETTTVPGPETFQNLNGRIDAHKEQISELEESQEQEIEELRRELSEKLAEVEDDLVRATEHIEHQDRQIDRIEDRQDKLDERLRAVENRTLWDLLPF